MIPNLYQRTLSFITFRYTVQKRVIKIILSSILFIAVSTGIKAQTDLITPAPVVPMSPNASSLAIYADYPVSHYTGVPNISVPLHEINIDGFKLPITLSYHASGIKVNQEASWVGLGWALNVGGSVSRSVKGRDDFLEYATGDIEKGYYKDADIANISSDYYYNVYSVGGNLQVLRKSLKIDTEPDIFYYSLPGASGKFIIDKARGPVLMEKSPNVRIEIVHDTSLGNTWNQNLCFRITTPDGIQYYYKRRETTRVYSSTSALNGNSTDPNRVLDDAGGPNQPEMYTSSWLLDQITTTNNRTVIFHYEKESYQSPTQESCIKYNYVGVPEGSLACGPGNGHVSYSTNKTKHESLRLSMVSWDGGYVSFPSSTREDLIGWKSEVPKKLDEVKVYNQNDVLMKTISLNYSYFNANQTGQYQYVFKRLKLDNVIVDNNQKNKYIFKYLPGDMLAKNSNNTDYWGFHNGKVYGSEYYVGITEGGTIYYGANKSANIDYTKIGTLKEIVYPTGGNTVFDYEANTFPRNAFNQVVPVTNPMEEKIVEVYNQYSTIGEYEGLSPNASYTFTLTQSARISIMKNIENPVSPQFDTSFPYANSGYPIGRFKKISPTTELIKSYPIPQVNGRSDYSEYVEYTYGSTPGSQDYLTATLTPGTYVFEALTPPKNIYVRWRISILHSSSPGPENSPTGGAGLRIAKITSGNRMKIYSYPTGTLMVSPVMAYGKTFKCSQLPYTGTQNTLVQLSNSSIPLSTLRNSNSVGYDWVDEITPGAGKTRYTFFNEPEEPLYETVTYAESAFPYAGTMINYANGLTKKIEYYRGTEIIKSTEYDYHHLYSSTIPGFMYNEDLNRTLWYGIKIAWMPKWSEVTRTAVAGTEGVEEAQLTTYNGYLQPSSIRTEVNDKWNERKIKYVTDLDDQVSQQMAAKYMVSTPVETIDLKEDLVVAGQKVSYAEYSGLFLPEVVSRLNTTIPLSQTDYQNHFAKELDYDLYDSWGKILQLRKFGDVKSYVWGYNSYYPIAEITNATYQSVSSVLGATTLQGLQDEPTEVYVKSSMDLLRNALPDAEVVSYTFKPQIGLSSITDVRGLKTSYEYDSFHRLSSISDFQNNLTKFYSYNYRGADHLYAWTNDDLPYRGLAWLECDSKDVFPGKFRVTLTNKSTFAIYVFDIDSNVKRFGGVPVGKYDISVINLDNRPNSDFSFFLFGSEYPDGFFPDENLDSGESSFQIFEANH